MRFDSRQHQAPSREPIPVSDQIVKIESAETKLNKNQTGRFLSVEVVVHEGPHRGRRLWANYTTEHSESPKAAEIGLSQISEMCRACGIVGFDHERELGGLIGTVRVKLQKDDPTKNEIAWWVVPKEMKGEPTYHLPRQAHEARKHDIHNERPGAYGGAAQSARRPEPPPEPAPSKRRFDDDIPF